MTGIEMSTLGILSSAASVAGTVAGAADAARTARDQSRMAAYNADVAQKQGEQGAALERERAKRLAGTQRAGMAASGLGLDSESGVALLAQTDADGEMQALESLRSGGQTAARWQAQAQTSARRKELALLGAGASVGRTGNTLFG